MPWDGNTQGQASQLLAIMQAILKPTASSTSGHKRMINGQAAASGEKRMELSEGIAWSGNMLNIGDILNMDGPLVEIEFRSVFGNSAVGGWSSQRGKVCARPEPAGGAWSEGTVASECEAGGPADASAGRPRVASGQWPVNAKRGGSR